ncbi:MAG: RNA polymerase subunit sigma [Flavobacteriia bacterium]|nr:MAG: RNA polymerase subunit sigma [Flavobacteriia bacterium]
MQRNNQHISRLIEHCRKGEQNAQFELYKLYYKSMFNTAYRILNDSFEAEDVMQESFLTAFTKLDSFREDAAFGGWLKRIVINRSLSQLKKLKDKQEISLEGVSYKMAEEEQEEDYDGLSTEMRTEELLQALQGLKENYRVVLNLRLIEGYDNEEIAQILNISNENCRTTISRAKNKLRSILSQKALIKG